MIFVTLGTQNFQMNRVIDEIDKLIEKGFLNSSDVIIQKGFSKDSNYAESFKMLSETEFECYMKKAEIVICHGGTSSIIKALEASKKVIAIPRKAQLKEHVDDHQLEIVDVFYLQGYLERVDDIENLEYIIQGIRGKEFLKYNQTGELSKIIVSSVLNISLEGK